MNQQLKQAVIHLTETYAGLEPSVAKKDLYLEFESISHIWLRPMVHYPRVRLSLLMIIWIWD